ncbi:hypothetical protein KP509_31G048600 [Ceratopteris richardii]|uniref:Uncharacterized protein n=1 Tax=Ceratopteris richardii TaxID=49495 RepID=A0A8T2QXP0_CERRI|nr:hypothetical protein KP509_31G048600 [Ceratopteris richardii]
MQKSISMRRPAHLRIPELCSSASGSGDKLRESPRPVLTAAWPSPCSIIHGFPESPLESPAIKSPCTSAFDGPLQLDNSSKIHFLLGRIEALSSLSSTPVMIGTQAVPVHSPQTVFHGDGSFPQTSSSSLRKLRFDAGDAGSSSFFAPTSLSQAHWDSESVNGSVVEGSPAFCRGAFVLVRCNQSKWLLAEVRRWTSDGIFVWVDSARVMVHVPFPLVFTHLAVLTNPIFLQHDEFSRKTSKDSLEQAGRVDPSMSDPSLSICHCFSAHQQNSHTSDGETSSPPLGIRSQSEDRARCLHRSFNSNTDRSPRDVSASPSVHTVL